LSKETIVKTMHSPNVSIISADTKYDIYRPKNIQ
jgi:hypothetical protein